jgi:hypothetical protein
VPLVKSALEEFVPSAADAIEVVKGRVVLVDGTLTPCWSYEEHQELWNKKHKTTGFNAQLISLLDGTAAWVSGPLPGKTHDARAFKETGAADILTRAGGGFRGGRGAGAGELAVYCRPVVTALAVVRRDGTVLADAWLPDLVRLGELERHLGDGVIEAAVGAAIAKGRLKPRQRRRTMSYPLVIRLMIAMALSPCGSYARRWPGWPGCSRTSR